MKFTISKEIKHALLIDEKNLRELHKFVSEKYKKVEIFVKCHDGSSLETEDIEEILSFENSNYRKIISITITGRNSQEEKLSISIINKLSMNIISVGSPFFESTAEYTIISNKEETAKFNFDKLTQYFSELKTSFFCDIFSRITLLSIIIFFWGRVSIIYWVKVIFDIIPRSSSNLSGIEAFSIMIITIIALILITYPFDLLRQWLFPRVFLSLGKQKKNMETIENWRKNIFIVLILGILVSVLGSLIARFVLKKT